MLTNVALITSLQLENKFYQLENTLPVLAMPICHIAPRATGHFIIKKICKRKKFTRDIHASTLCHTSLVFHASDLIYYKSRFLVLEAGVDPPDFDS